MAWLRVTPYLGNHKGQARTLARDGVTQDPDKRPLPRCAHTPVAQSLGATVVLPLRGGSGGFGVSSQFESSAPNTRPIRIYGQGGLETKGLQDSCISQLYPPQGGVPGLGCGASRCSPQKGTG